MHNAHHCVKSKRTPKMCILHEMTFDDRPEPAKRLKQAREERGFRSAKDAAVFFGWNYDTYAQHENGLRGIGRAVKRYALAFRVSEAWLLTGEGDGSRSQKVSGEQAVKHLLSRIDKLPEAALQPIWRLIEGYIKDAEQSAPSHSPAQTEPANPRREREPTR